MLSTHLRFAILSHFFLHGFPVTIFVRFLFHPSELHVAVYFENVTDS